VAILDWVKKLPLAAIYKERLVDSTGMGSSLAFCLRPGKKQDLPLLPVFFKGDSWKYLR